MAELIKAMPVGSTDISPIMPSHFIPVEASFVETQLEFIVADLAKINLVGASQQALAKFKEQTEKNLPDPKNIKEENVVSFLDPKTRQTDEFRALQSKYSELQNLKNEHRSISSYKESAKKIVQDIDQEFAKFLKKEKQAFHEAYAAVCPEEAKRKALWVMYENNLTKNIQNPLKEFTKDLDQLRPQAFIHWVNNLGETKTYTSQFQTGKSNETLNRKLQYKDSKGKFITIIKDDETGKPSALRVDPLSPTFLGFTAKSGDLGDAYAIMAAYYGKDIPIKIVVPIAENNINATEMEGVTQFIVMLIAALFRRFEEKHYKNRLKNAALEKGISLDNISLIDTRGKPLVFSPKTKDNIIEKLKEFEKKHANDVIKQQKIFDLPPQEILNQPPRAATYRP